MRGSRDQLSELTQNLCDNAIRYNRPGGHVELRCGVGGDGCPYFEVEDNGIGIPKLVERFSPASCRSPEQLAATLAEFDKVYGAHMHDKTAPYPGMPALLARLKAAGVRMAVFSNKADEFARAVVARYFDADLFEVVRGALPDVPTKPAPEGTRALMAHLGVEADGSVLYVGDSNVDVETAHNAGLPCCGVLWGFRTREELTEAGAEYLAEDTQGLEKVVLG